MGIQLNIFRYVSSHDSITHIILIELQKLNITSPQWRNQYSRD